MDALIAGYPARPDRDLVLCEAEGVAYQQDMTELVPYDDAYFEKYKSYEGTPVATALNAGRCAMLMRHAAEGASVLDIGAGCGTFVEAAKSWGFAAAGFDINPKTVEYLRCRDAYADDPAAFDVVTFWDSLEHIPDPGAMLQRVARGALVLVAIPVFEDLGRIRESKHYRPGEHLYYVTDAGFVRWMASYGFRLIERSDHENAAGRESIGAYAFRRDLIATCPCGGETYVDDWAWPGRPLQFFLRCGVCGGMSDTAPTKEEAERLAIRPEQAAEAKTA